MRSLGSHRPKHSHQFQFLEFAQLKLSQQRGGQNHKSEIDVREAVPHLHVKQQAADQIADDDQSQQEHKKRINSPPPATQFHCTKQEQRNDGYHRNQNVGTRENHWV